MRVCVLASGSSGNCVLVASATTHVLIDAGLSGRETLRRLNAVGLDVSRIDGVCLTHEHDDHRSALPVLHRRHGTTLYANAGTIEAVQHRISGVPLTWNVFATGSPFPLGDLVIEPFSVPHDSYDPVGFVLRSGKARVGVVTDMGMPTALIREHLRACQVIVLEANHDETMLKASNRPWTLKQRIAGRQGHLSNRAAAELLCELGSATLRTVYLAHLSRDCNTPDVALRTVCGVLQRRGLGHVDVRLTYPDRISEIAELD